MHHQKHKVNTETNIDSASKILKHKRKYAALSKTIKKDKKSSSDLVSSCRDTSKQSFSNKQG